MIYFNLKTRSSSKAIFLILLSYYSCSIQAQQENIWVFGQRAGLDFSSGRPVAFESAISGFGEGCASVCDKDGKLLFYTEGTYVWDREGKPMPNGYKLTGLPANADQYTATSSTSQGALIVPLPGSPFLYYIFSLTAVEAGADLGRLYYSIVDMRLNGGMGDVQPAGKGTLLDTLLTEHMAGVTGDRCNIWIIVYSRKQQEFRAIEITASGISSQPAISKFNQQNGQYVLGRINVSPNRKKLAIGRSLSSGGGSLELYDFDPATGYLHNPVTLGKYGYYGVCFSADNSKLYARHMAAASSIEQYDLSRPGAESINNSRFVVGASPFTDLKRGPDGKIYFQSRSNYIGIIHQPNLAGALCRYQDTAILLQPNSSMHAGLPNAVPLYQRQIQQAPAHYYTGPCFADPEQQILKARNDSSGWNYLWNNGWTGLETAITGPGTYWVSYYTAPCIAHTDTFHVAFPLGVLPRVMVQPACKDRANATAYAYTYAEDTVTYHYEWRNSSGVRQAVGDTLGNVPGGIYTLRIQTPSCDTILTVPIPEETYRAGFDHPALVCAEDELYFNNLSDNHFQQFEWSFGDGGTATGRFPQHRYNQPGKYRVRLIAVGAVCTDTVYGELQVDNRLASFSFQKSPAQLCAGQQLDFAPLFKDSTLLHFEIQLFAEGVAAIVPPSSFRWTVDQSGRVPFQITGVFRACPESVFYDTVLVYPLPSIQIDRDSLLCFRGYPLTLSNLSESPPGTQYLWNTGATTPSIQVTDIGIYSLTLTNNAGCSGTASVRIHKDCYSDIPNAFSPNGDGSNDFFYPRQLLTSSARKCHLKIFNRWGQMVFETRLKEGRGWDGRFNGTDQPAGLYIYHANIMFENGQEEQYQGNVTLVR